MNYKMQGMTANFAQIVLCIPGAPTVATAAAAARTRAPCIGAASATASASTSASG